MFAHQREPDLRDKASLSLPRDPRPVASSFPDLGDLGRAQNPYKTRTKSDHFREWRFSNASAKIVYDFNALKCTDFHQAAAEVTWRSYPLRSGRIRTISEFALHSVLSSSWLRLRAPRLVRIHSDVITVRKRIKVNKTEYKCQGPSQTIPTPNSCNSCLLQQSALRFFAFFCG